MKDFEQIKNNLNLNDIKKILEYFNAFPILKNNYIIAKTICHNGDSHKLYYYNNTKLFKCYTGCSGETFDIYELIEKIYYNQNKSIKFNEIIQLIGEIIGKQNLITNYNNNNFKFYSNEQNLIEKQKNFLNLQNETNEFYKFNYYNENILKYLDKVIVEEWEKEGINKKTHEKYGICFYPLTGQIIIPHYDIYNKLIGIRGRFIRDEDVQLYGKYRPVLIQKILYTHPLSYSLYGLNFNHLAISKSKKAIIFEGEKSVMIYDSFFGSENNISVACCGSSLSNYQIDLLLKLNVNEIILAFDKQYQQLDDEENKKYINNILKICEKIINYCSVSVIYDKENNLKYKDSPIDEGKNIFLKLFDNRIHITDNMIKKELKLIGI